MSLILFSIWVKVDEWEGRILIKIFFKNFHIISFFCIEFLGLEKSRALNFYLQYMRSSTFPTISSFKGPATVSLWAFLELSYPVSKRSPETSEKQENVAISNTELQLLYTEWLIACDSSANQITALRVSNGLCEHLRACEECVYFCEHEQ